MVHMCVCVWSGVAVCVCLTHVRQASAAAARLLAHQGRQTHTHTHMHCLTAVWKLDSMMPLAVPLGNGSRQSMIMSLRICVSMNTPSTAVISRYGMVREGSGSYTASPLKPGVPLGAPPRFKYVWYDMPAVRVVRSVRVARACARQVRARAASDILCDATGAVPEGGGGSVPRSRCDAHADTHTNTHRHAACSATRWQRTCEVRAKAAGERHAADAQDERLAAACVGGVWCGAVVGCMYMWPHVAAA
jgi:hypothetical protein